jgi:NAD(P)-dependent dehydrogenase (short-subunit alcohol dehydrogenase family)
MTRKVCIITGANSGIGRAASVSLAASGQIVVMLCRSPERGQAAHRTVIDQSGSDAERVHLVQMDMSSQASIRAGAQVLRERFEHIDVLINNAAFFDISVKQPVLTEDGHEMTWATNHLGPFLLTTELLAPLQAARGRVINIGSKGWIAYPFLSVDLENLDGSKGYSTARAYYQSKLAQLVFTRELARRYEGQITANVVRVPAVKVPDERLPELNPILLWIYKLKRRAALDPEEMARTYHWMALSEEAAALNGEVIDEKQRVISGHRAANDEALWTDLWRISEEMVGASPPAHERGSPGATVP